MENTIETIMKKTIVVWFGALLCCTLWGSAFPCIKIGYNLFSITPDDTYSQILFAGCRFTLAGVLAIAIGSILNKKILIPQKNSWIKIAKLSMIQTVAQYVLFYVGLAHTTGVKASIIEAINVFIAILIASIFFKQEKLTMIKIVGCILGFAGVTLINLTKNGMDMNMQWNGEGFIFLSTIACALSSVYLKDYSKDENPVILSGYQFILGGLIMAVYGSIMDGQLNVITAPAFAMLIYLALISAVAYSVWGILLKYNPVSKVTVFGFMTPVFGVILSALFLSGENEKALGIKSIVALILVCIGIYIVNSKWGYKDIDNSSAL